MFRSRLFKFAVLSTLLLLILTATALAASRNYRTHLNGALEIPGPIDTKAQGQAIFQLSKDGNSMSYKLIVANIENVRMAHIHVKDPDSLTGQTGPVVVWLYPDASPGVEIPGRFQGVLGEGIITSQRLVGPLAGQPLSALLQAIESGEAYVNVHTTQNMPGEIRGNLP
jgi:hypothetical protein